MKTLLFFLLSLLATHSLFAQQIIADGGNTQVGIRIENANHTGLQVLNSFNGIDINNMIYSGISIHSVGSSGIDIHNPGLSGIYINDAGIDGIGIYNSAEDGIFIHAAGEIGLNVFASGEDGIFVDQAGNNGIFVQNSTLAGFRSTGSTTGLDIDHPLGYGIDIFNPGTDGIYIYGAGHDGLYIDNASDDGIEIHEAANHGIEITNSASGTGMEISDGLHGIKINSPALYGIDVRTTGSIAVAAQFVSSDFSFTPAVIIDHESDFAIDLDIGGQANIRSGKGYRLYVNDDGSGLPAFKIHGSTPNPILELSHQGELTLGHVDDGNNAEISLQGDGVIECQKWGHIQIDQDSNATFSYLDIEDGADEDIFYINEVGTTWTKANAHVNGMLSKGSGSFKIDHPLDPENKYLYHSFVESPDMMNIYNGNATLNENGEAVVQLKEWFDALNSDFRYQLTAVDAPGPNLFIKEELQDNQFTIAGGQPGSKVSWQITGIRKDPYAKQNRIPVEVEKEEYNKGKYLHPEAWENNSDRKNLIRVNSKPPKI